MKQGVGNWDPWVKSGLEKDNIFNRLVFYFLKKKWASDTDNEEVYIGIVSE